MINEESETQIKEKVNKISSLMNSFLEAIMKINFGIDDLEIDHSIEVNESFELGQKCVTIFLFFYYSPNRCSFFHVDILQERLMEMEIADIFKVISHNLQKERLIEESFQMMPADKEKQREFHKRVSVVS